METKVKINIDNYISEEEKKEIAINVFRQQVKKELFKENSGTVQSDSEIQRIIGNITHRIVFNEIEEYIPDARKQIKKGVEKALSKDLSYEVFKVRDAWGGGDSLAVKITKETVKENEELLKERIKETIKNFDFEKTVSNKISEQFDKIADSLYSLSDLFNKS